MNTKKKINKRALKCQLGIHSWTLWSSVFWDYSHPYQLRTCRVCNKVDGKTETIALNRLMKERYER